MQKIIFSDKLKSQDHGLFGKVIIGKGKKLVPMKDIYGNTVFRTEFEEVLFEKENIVTIGGYQFIFNKLFNIGIDQESTLRVGDLNDEAPMMRIGVPRANYKSINYNSENSTSISGLPNNAGINISANNFIFGFMIGDGGSMQDNITAIAPNYKDRTLFRAIPFRMSNDGKPMKDNKYYGKFVTSPNTNGERITSYYIKKFDDPKPHIIHSFVSDNYNELEIVDDSIFFSTTSTPIESYVEMNLSVDEFDLRGYFNTHNASPRMNEIGLVAGWYNRELDDYESIRLISHFSRSSILLEEGDTIDIVYRLYAR